MAETDPEKQIVLATTARTTGGLWRHVLDLAGGLRAAGWRVGVALPDDADALRAECASEGIEVVRPADRPTRRWMGKRAHPVLHVHLADTFDRPSLRLVLRARLRGHRVVITEHLPRTNASDPTLTGGSTNPIAYIAKSVFKIVEFLAAHRVVAVSHASATFLARRYRISPRKIMTVPNGIAVAPGATDPPEGPVRFVAVGSLIQQKGMDVLVAASKLARHAWVVDVYGDGPHRERLQSDADVRSDDGVGCVRFHGWSTEVSAALISSDALVLPSRWESAPYVVLEAMERGRAVIGTRVDGLEEMVDSTCDGSTGTGVLVEADDPRELARALDAMAQNKTALRAMGAAGRLKVERLFSVTEMVRGTEGVYRSLGAGA